MFRVCLYLASTVKYPDCRLLLVTSVSDLPMRIQLNYVVFSSAYPSTDKNDVELCCHKQDSLMHGASSSVCVINKWRGIVL